MTWLRKHWEGIRVVAVTTVGSEGLGYRVQLSERDGPKHWSHEKGHFYDEPAIAFHAADALVRRRHAEHACGASCTGWIDTADLL
jgi:hypothetical protein